MKLNDIRIGKRFFIIFTIITAVTIAGFVYIMTNMTTQKKEVDLIYNTYLIGIEKLIEADRDAYQSSIAISQAINGLYGGRKQADAELLKAIDENLDQIKERFDAFSKLYLATGAEKTDEFRIIDEQYAKLSDQTKAITGLLKAGDTVPALALYNGAYAAAFRDLRGAMDRLTEASLSRTDQEYRDFHGKYTMSVAIAVGASIIILALLMTSGFTLTRSILRPIKKAVDLSRKLATGDFRERMALTQKDEFGDMARELDRAMADLDGLVGNVATMVSNLAQAVEQIAGGNQNLSQRTSEQAWALEEMASTIEEATASIQQNADNSLQAKDLAADAATRAGDGNRVVRGAVQSINEINDSGKRIAEIIKVIDDIAFQTNLLALNAAVEAARAGEQGRGFAVVAGEVRNLAQRTASSAKDISGLITDSVNKVARGTELVNRSGEQLDKIVESIAKVNSLITEISAASAEQKNGIEQINVAVSEMDTMTQQNAALVEETASTSEEMAAQARELRAMMERFKISDLSRGRI